ncbi:NAD(P)-dependent alcohol dehydrogenase [Pusillimonas sp. NJUB218]|uniref:NAD(P)-dependent alcohol dehydrogenase n=1 Tax=Pusillimonas sp. NJUB218 TaxID=2023230 RepID=UPI000F4B4EBF|nr:NAD(P)-dependent alcohol dehydrogenase [Pusillimonas sp. NJUB218]ROT45714.1 alcohol dehydrogenase [Pusillimonas sp. NJUB218]
MTTEITAAVSRKSGEPFSIETLTLEAPRDNEVLVRVVATGICHTDVNMRNSDVFVPKPIVLGHEGAGIVERVGRSVQKVKPGDHVVISFDSCGTCQSCRKGDSVYCQHLGRHAFSGKRIDGTTALKAGNEPVHSHFFGQSSFGTYSLCTERTVVPVDKSVDLELLGPLGCGIQTGAGAVINSLKVAAGSRIAILGTGSVGLAAVMAARLCGAATIIAVDTQDSRLGLAMELGATHTINGAKEETFDVIRSLAPEGLNYVVDTTGSLPLIKNAVNHLAPRGVCGLINTAKGADAQVNILQMVLGGRTVRGIHQGDSVPDIFIPQMIELYRQGRFPFDRLLKFYDLANINQAMEDMDKGVTIKPVVRMG